MAERDRPEAEERSAERPVVYCLIPYELAPKLHDLLRKHFREDPDVEAIVEQRHRERRRRGERRHTDGESPLGEERRLIRGEGGRRVGEQRAPVAEVEPPPLPRRAGRYAEQLRFVARREPAGERAEDHDTARLIARFQAGERDVFDVLYARYFDRIYGYLRLALGDIHEAEDLTQEVLMRVLEALPRYERRRQPFRAWLFTVARNEAISQLRKTGRVEAMDPEELARRRERQEAAPEEEIPAFDWLTDRDLQVLVERLPVPQRQVLTMRFLLDLPHEEVARALGRTEVDVRTLQHRALNFLRERLTKLGRTPASRSDRAGTKRAMEPANVLRARRFSLM